MALSTSDIGLIRQSLTQELRERWVLFLIEGLVLILLGVLALLAWMVGVITVETSIAWVILVFGVVGHDHGIRRNFDRWPRRQFIGRRLSAARGSPRQDKGQQ